MAAIAGKWYASVGTHDSNAYLEGNGAVRFVYATQESGEKYIVAKVWSGDDGDYAGTARLVAAAPEMLAALKLIARKHETGDGDFSVAELCHAMVAKAEGKEGE
jgi:hypothetical protein